MLIAAQAKKKRKTMQAKKRLVTANDSDSNSCSSHAMSSGEEDILDATTSDDEVYQDVTPPNSIKGDFALLRFRGPKRKQHYIGKAVDVFDDADITFKFLRRLDHSNLLFERPTFVFPKNFEELFTHHMSDIVLKLPVPLNRKDTKRYQQKLIFPIDLSRYNRSRFGPGLRTRTRRTRQLWPNSNSKNKNF